MHWSIFPSALYAARRSSHAGPLRSVVGSCWVANAPGPPRGSQTVRGACSNGGLCEPGAARRCVRDPPPLLAETTGLLGPLLQLLSVMSPEGPKLNLLTRVLNN